MATAVFNSLTRPGTFLNEGTAGVRSSDLAAFNTIYVFGSATNGAYNTPTSVTSLTDFFNQFGGSLSEPSLKLLFRNDRLAKVYFIRAGIAEQATVTISTASAGPYTLIVNGTSVTHTSATGDTKADVVQGLITAVNSSDAAVLVDARAGTTDDTLSISVQNPDTDLLVTTSAGAMTVADSTPSQLTPVDFVSAIENSFDYEEEWPQGFLIAPQAFQTFANPTDRLRVGSAMEALASKSEFDWVALIDCGPEHMTSAQLKADAQQYASPEGHSQYYAPYLTDTEGDTVPASAAVAAIATLRFRQEGYHQPYAGMKYAIKGVTDTDVKFGNIDQSILNPLGVNLIRNLTNKGVVIWGMRSRSQNPFYKFTVTRVIMNVLNGTLRRAFDDELFSSIDGFGISLMRKEETARAVCRRMWRDKALFGDSEAEAFEVRSNLTNNDPDQLESGNVLIEVYAATSPATEKILVQTYRVSIGGVQESAASGVIG